MIVNGGILRFKRLFFDGGKEFVDDVKTPLDGDGLVIVGGPDANGEEKEVVVEIADESNVVGVEIVEIVEICGVVEDGDEMSC